MSNKFKVVAHFTNSKTNEETKFVSFGSPKQVLTRAAAFLRSACRFPQCDFYGSQRWGVTLYDQKGKEIGHREVYPGMVSQFNLDTLDVLMDDLGFFASGNFMRSFITEFSPNHQY